MATLRRIMPAALIVALGIVSVVALKSIPINHHIRFIESLSNEECSLVPEKQEYFVGQRVNVYVVIRNEGSQELSVDIGSPTLISTTLNGREISSTTLFGFNKPLKVAPHSEARLLGPDLGVIGFTPAGAGMYRVYFGGHYVDIHVEEAPG